MAARTSEAVVRDYTERLMAVRGVVGTGIGERDGLPCIRVFVESATAELTQRIPAWLEGYAVEVVETGSIRPRRLSPEHSTSGTRRVKECGTSSRVSRKFSAIRRGCCGSLPRGLSLSGSMTSGEEEGDSSES